MSERELCIEEVAGGSSLDDLKKYLAKGYTQLDLNTALENAVAYSRVDNAEHLFSLGADIAYGDYQGLYYATYGEGLEGIKWAISKGVDINIRGGMLLANTVITVFNGEGEDILEWLLANGANLSDVSTDNRNMMKTFDCKSVQEILKRHNNSCHTTSHKAL